LGLGKWRSLVSDFEDTTLPVSCKDRSDHGSACSKDCWRSVQSIARGGPIAVAVENLKVGTPTSCEENVTMYYPRRRWSWNPV